LASAILRGVFRVGGEAIERGPPARASSGPERDDQLAGDQLVAERPRAELDALQREGDPEEIAPVEGAAAMAGAEVPDRHPEIARAPTAEHRRPPVDAAAVALEER